MLEGGGTAPHPYIPTSLPLPRRFLDLAAADAPGADAEALDTLTHHHPDALQIRDPAPAGDVVGVADPVSEYRRFAADFTHFCHLELLK